jgi:tetratricopeptide (TPR) repeat protein
VKALGVGDVLEYRAVLLRTKPEAQGHFWYAYNFFKDRVVLDETLRISMPVGQYVKVSSPALAPERKDENGRAVYTWKSSCAKPATSDEKEPAPRLRQPRPAVQITTFRTWEEVGKWYAALQQTRLETTPAIRAKAAELTAGLDSSLAKQRAIYQYVSTKFRYISISFGEGRRQPHSADETLANQYGDCKDKHTLFAALLKAAGIESAAALVGSGLEFDDDVPSPAQFNHVITYLPQGGAIAWLDTTPEVAPYGWLEASLREQKALVVPEAGDPRVVTIPAVLPLDVEESVDAKCKLTADGTLTGHFDMKYRGDAEVLFRTVFHGSPPARWREVAQNISGAMGYGGTLREVDVSNPSDLDAPFHYSYNYERKPYGDWPNRRITPPFPPISLLSTEDKDKPKDSIPFGTPGRIVYRATIELPEGYSVEIPPGVNVKSALGDYSAAYAVKDNTLSVERVFTIKSAKLSVAQWEEYCKFAKSVEGDVQRMIQLVHTDSGATSRVVRDDPQAAEFVQKAAQALQSRNFNVARDALAQAERINPEQSGLWMTRAFVYALQSQNEKAVDALKKEIEYHPGNTPTYQFLGALQVQLGHRDEAIAALRQWVKVAPEDPDAVHALASSLIEVKKYDEAAVPLRAALKADPDNLRLNVTLADVLVRGGHKPEAIALVEKLREKPLDAHMLNQIAWSLADTNTEPALARDLSAKAIADYENQLKDVTLQSLSREHLDLVDPLGATWDTLGWAWFELGELDKAERYLNAAWVLLQNPSVADHLGQLRERQGRKADAIRAYKLALAVKSDLPDTRERLVKLGGAAEERPSLRRGVQSAPKISPEEEVSEIRTTRLPDLKAKPGSAEFFLLFSAKGVEDVQFLRGDEHLKSAAGALRSAHHNAPFPDAGPAKIARRGILSCSAVTAPACSLVLLLPVNTTLN